MHASAAETTRVTHLVDLAYTMAKEEIPFTKFGPLADNEKRAGVNLGESYLNEIAAQEFR